MSRLHFATAPEAPVLQVLTPKAKDLGSFTVKRALPSPQCRMIGPFAFLDQMGPAVFGPGQGIDVRPHPHIGLATVTFLYQGSMLHADSLGNSLEVRPGEVNWMTAGHGITHSERTSDTARAATFTMEGLQTWVALPADQEDCAPAFEHFGATELPQLTEPGLHVTLILGSLYGETSPCHVYSPIFYADAQIQAGHGLSLDSEYTERAFFVTQGQVELAGQTYEAGQLVVLKPGQDITLTAVADSRLMLLGGEPLAEPRHLFWNFVSSDPAKIEQAKADWQAEDWVNGRFTLPPTDQGEFIPLP